MENYKTMGTLSAIYVVNEHVKVENVYQVYAKGDRVYAAQERVTHGMTAETLVTMQGYESLNSLFWDLTDESLNSLFWDLTDEGAKSISVSPEEDFAETWLDFAIEEYANAPMTEVERSCFRNLMASCLSVLI